MVKHGNRSASSKSGSADVLEVLGIRIDLSASEVARVAHGPASRSASPPPSIPPCGTPRWRGASSGVGTTFDFLGPIANPARPEAQASVA